MRGDAGVLGGHGARPGASLKSPVPELASPLAVVCHDAGATNLILPWLDLDRVHVRAFVQGPADKLWRDRFGERGLVGSLDEAIGGAQMLLSGTGWASDLEHRARIEAAAHGLHSVAVIDHWVNYAPRFQRDGHRVMPDQIWVTDAEAFALAQATFPGHDVRLHPNLYLRAQVEHIAACPDPRTAQTVLYVLEPARDDWGRGVPGEYQALDYFVACADTLGLRRPLTLRLRPHPSDPPGKYDDWIARQRDAELDVEIDDAASLGEAIDRVAWVAGCESMALVVGLAAGRRVVCTLPPWAPPCRLPHRGLIHLQRSVEGVRSVAQRR